MNSISCTIFFIILLFLNISCSTEVPHPVTIGVIYDCSQSAPQNQVPSITANHLDSLIALSQRYGGTLAFLPISKASFIEIDRLELESMAKSTLREKAILSQHQKTKIADYKKRVLDVVSNGRQATRTDFWGAIHRCNLLFQEATAGVARRKYLLLVSDCLDDIKAWPPIELPEDVSVLAVGLSNKSDAVSMSPHIMIFENITPALRHLRYLTQNNKEVGGA